MITQEELDVIENFKLIDFTTQPTDMKERAFKYIDVYLMVNSTEGLKYLRKVVFLNDR